MDAQQFNSSARFRAKYFRALKRLSKQLNETWERVFPQKALIPLRTCEEFFGPFAEFGVVLYDAYAEELLDSNPPQEQYLEALHFDLKTLVCDRIYPFRENPIRTFKDAMAAEARGELPGEWTVRMGEAWRLFEHPRHSGNNGRVYEFIIDVDRSCVLDRVHAAISRRTIHWLSEHAERAAAIEAGNGSKETRAADRAFSNRGSRQGYRAEIRAFMKTNGLTTNAIAARYFGVSVDALKSIMSDKGKLRCSEETRAGVLTKARIEVR